MTIVQIDPLFIEAYVPAALWGRITVGSHGSVVLDQPDKQSRDALVTVVDKMFDAASGTFGVRLELPNPDDLIPAGQRCQVAFEVGRRLLPRPEHLAPVPQNGCALARRFSGFVP